MAAANAFSAAYNPKSLTPQPIFGWDTNTMRRSRYLTYDNFMNNTAYSTINNQAAAMKLDNNMYKHGRGIYNPVARFTNLSVSYISGGELDMDSLTTGSLPIVTDNEAIRTALIKLLEWSRWGENKSLYVETGVNKGDTYIKIVDDRQRRKVRLELLPPEFIRDIEFDEVGNIKAVVIEYERDEVVDVQAAKPGMLGGALSRKGKTFYLYTEKITKDFFETFKDGEPFAFYTNSNGEKVSRWDNEYGFIPLVHQTHSQAGLGLWSGKNGYYNTLTKIHEINDQASIISDKIRQILQPIVYVEGATRQEQIDTATTDKDQMTLLFGPAGSKMTPVVIDLNISAALENLNNMIRELESDLPVLSLQRIREGSNLTAPGVEMGYSDAIWSVKQARSRYDAAFVRAGQMAIAVAGYNGYEGFEGFGLDSYAAGNLQFYIANRPVINDSLSINEHIIALSTIGSLSAPLQELALKKLDYSKDDIANVVLATEEAVRNATRGFAEQLFPDTSNGDTGQLGQGNKQLLQLPEKVGVPA